MKLIIQERASGKTHGLIERMAEAKRVGQPVLFVTPSMEPMANFAYIDANVQYPDLEWSRDEFLTLGQYQKRHGMDLDTLILVDQLDYILGHLFRTKDFIATMDYEDVDVAIKGEGILFSKDHK